jgi:hypothetical protein
MNITKAIRKLCTPAYVYLVMSMISIIILMAQNAGNDTKFCIGSYTCKVMSTSFVFFCQALYTAIWTFILDSVCKKGYNNISWFLVLFPYLLFFIIIGLFILGDKKKEGFKEGVAGEHWLNNEKNTSGTSSPHKRKGRKRSRSKYKTECVDSAGTALSENNCKNKNGCVWTQIGELPSCYDDKANCMDSSGIICSGQGECNTSPAGGTGHCKCNCGWEGQQCSITGCGQCPETLKASCRTRLRAAAAKKKKK